MKASLHPAATRKRVVVFRSRLPGPLLRQLRRRYSVEIFPDPEGRDQQAFRVAVRQAHGLIGSHVEIDAELIKSARHLEVVASTSAGVDNYDIACLTRRGILLTNVADALTETVADNAWGLLLATARRIVESAEHVKTGGWQANPTEKHFGIDVHGKRLGLLGFGRIGQAIARRGRHGFGMKILYHSRSRRRDAEEALDARYCRFNALLEESDFVCVTVPLSAATEHWIGRREFSRMRPGAVFINVSRGPIVDEQALVEALRSGKIKAAALDVFEREPLPADSPLLSLPNVVATPHIGSLTKSTRLAMARLACRNLIAALDGQRPPSLVNPEAWDRKARSK